MHIIFCVDRGVLPGLHVAAYSLLDRIHPAAGNTHFSIFSDALHESDVVLLQRTLTAIGKPFALELQRADPVSLVGFPTLNGNLATYYRLFAAQIMEVDRFLYVDADTLCDVDVSELQSLDMKSAPVAWVPEAPLSRATDRNVAEQLGNDETASYFNAGVMLVNVSEWRRQKVTENAMEYIARYRPAFHDQSALNCVLYQNAQVLDAKFNCMSNMRKNWPVLKQPYGNIGRFVHFLDYPKPWDCGAEMVHPQYRLWRTVLNRTAMKDFRSWHGTPARKFPRTSKAWGGYKKAFKDRLLFAGYAKGWLRCVKGVPVTSNPVRVYEN
jgi:lipopolysaccharide biosynthesis glycosyltransferase